MMKRSWRTNAAAFVVITALTFSKGLALAQPAGAFRPGQYAGAQLHYVGHIPILHLSGTAEDRGRQIALAAQHLIPALISYPEELYGALGSKKGWARHLELAQKIRDKFPPEHLRELSALAEAAGVAEDVLLAVNTLPDFYRALVGCSSIVVDKARSATGGPIFGRNLDFHGLGKLHKFAWVVIYHPPDKHRFAAVTFPGFLGCLSGINDAGLALAVHESGGHKPGTPSVDPEGIPQGFLCRRILEECASVDDAIKLLRACRHTAPTILVLCDPRRHAVVEFVPGEVAVRGEKDTVVACTNHFRTALAGTIPMCPRYEKLIKAEKLARISVADVISVLHAANQGERTIQTMVFEPQSLRLHLSLGSIPASAGPFVSVDLKTWFANSQPLK
ncbi:MAG: C45 family peptidase [Thermoguttaceae bacterium]|nr:C45 family peptidase [Thermoguttaceae bacterium]MDW8078035.1 C45 family peptidase [Thermoguttaceae bacterium]